MSSEDIELTVPELNRDSLLILDDPDFDSQTVAIVTGAASGIGQATAVALACNGLTVIGGDIDGDGLAETVELAQDLDATGEVLPSETNLLDDSDVTEMVDTATDAGNLRYVANIAGMQHIASLVEFPMDKYDLLLDIMLRAPFLTAKTAISAMEADEHGYGAVANMSSVHGHYATRDKPAYITAKHGLTGLTRAIAAEGRGLIRGFSVSVGYVLTPLMKDQIEDTAAEREISQREVIEDVMLGQARTKELMTPAEVANLFVFGFSSHGKHLNGADLLWDGGFTTTYA